MTLVEQLAITYWNAAQHVARGGRPDHALAAARVAEEDKTVTTCTLTATYSGLVDVEIDADAIAATLPTNAHRNQITDAVRDAAFDLARGEVTGARWVGLDGVQIAVDAVIRALDVKAAREAVSK